MTIHDVSSAVAARRSVRAFRDDPVPTTLVRDLLERAGRAPSGGNLQPWWIYVVNGAAMDRLRAHLAERPPVEEPGYEIYPPNLWEPHRTSRYDVGEQLYGALGIPRDDVEGRMAQLSKNATFFGAPVGLFCYVDRRMGPPQWSDLGMFLQTFMLLATEAGLATCAQEYWTVRQQAVGEFVDAPEEWLLFCGVALGHEDPDAPINGFTTDRRPVDDWATFIEE